MVALETGCGQRVLEVKSLPCREGDEAWAFLLTSSFNTILISTTFVSHSFGAYSSSVFPKKYGWGLKLFGRGLFERLRWQCHQTEPHHRSSLPRGNGQDCDVCRCNLKSTAAVCTEERGHEQVSKESGYPLESFKHWDNQKVTPPFIS